MSEDFSLNDGKLIKYTGNSETVSIPSGTAAIGSMAFNRNPYIKAVSIPDGVKYIESSAFIGCSGLESVSIPKTVEFIGGSAFYGNISLREIAVSKDSAYFCSSDGVLFTRDMKTLIACPDRKTGIYHIPYGVTEIKELAFDGCIGLKAIALPESLRSIGDRVFWGCTGLSDINLHSGIESIGNSAFYNCSSLTAIDIPAGVKYIGDRAFAYCCRLNKVHIPESVESIGEIAFRDCFQLEEAVLSCGLKQIGGGAFFNCYKLSEITIPETVETIGPGAFDYCSSLKRIDILSKKLDFGSYKAIADIKEGIDVRLLAAPEISAWENLTDIQQKRLILCALNNLSGLKSEAKYVYGGYIRNNAERLLPLLADNADICRMEFFAHEGILSPSTYSAFLDLTRSRAEITAWLLDYCNRNFSVQIIENEFEKELSEIFSL